MRRLIFTAAAAAVFLTVTGCLAPSAPPSPSVPKAPLASRRPLTPVPTPMSPLVGVFERGAPDDWSQVAEFASTTGVQPGIAVYYSPWNYPFSTSFALAAWQNDAYVLVQLQPSGVPVASIAAGDSDVYLRSFAHAVAAFRHPVILSFGHEMNGTWYSWGAGHASPATFVAAWRHIVRVFRAAGAANVTWLWTVNSIDGTSSPLLPWWPGAAWVNWIGIDGYYVWPTDTFGSVFGSTIADIRTFSGAPLLIAETAVGTTADRESQIGALFAGVRADHLAGVVWFDATQHEGIYHQNWRLEDDPVARVAFSLAAAKYLGAGDSHA